MTPVNESAIPVKPAGVRPRLDGLDLLRGAVMIIMALDHTRDFVSRDAMLFDPTDLSRTNGWLFLTRWITHFCAPVFCFLAGTGAFLSLGRGRSKRDLSWFLLTRGFWLILLELTLVQFGWTFRIDPHFLGGQVIWALGWSMVVLAALIYLPLGGVAAFGLVMIAGHNLLDPIRPAAFGTWSWLWTVLHVQGPVQISKTYMFFAVYPLIPWIGVMAAGFAFGSLFRRDRAERRRVLLWLGIGLIAAFVLLRATNLYGDPHSWSAQKSTLFTIFSFIDCAKYPPSLLYLLMTLGPAILALSFLDRDLGSWSKPIIVFGRVPLFYYLLHLPLIHGLAVFFAYLKHGAAGGVWFGPPWDPQTAAAYPNDYGYGLIGVYAIWLLAILLLYPLCRWFAHLKQRRRDAWLSYF
ncbi:MAG: heparan-alpha-glucosaminide N-acetyltransferase domain-containing protein [Verrucomicrobiota bacterium]|nr:heparan-alpha-glucosaminide N-acetyltransferase domain-containing protein [Verrucomicrobiota bacterium]